MTNTKELPKVGITGASGFVGKALIQRLLDDGYETLCLGRRDTTERTSFCKFDISDQFDVTEDLRAINVLVHCAARAHVMNEQSENPLKTYRKYNTDSTIRLAEQAASAGVSRFIYLSSVKAVGESTTNREPYRYDSVLAPEDAYGISKADAERGLLDIVKNSGMEVTIIRPPLVYGPGVKANFAAMLKLARKNLPLPLGSIKNQRSLVAIDNLVDLIVTCTTHRSAGNNTFMVSDGRDVTTPELLSAMTKAYGKSPKMIKFPPKLLALLATALGKKSISDRLLDSLAVDIEHTRSTLNWEPKVNMDEALAKCTEGVGN
ncbi:NAD-dependent epimerase/dehydratase family protein [Idiomarina abyssalis]|uniref:NAD-dependent epimerase/dehydratase family protein n=1 Tax=Idiomarina abyssalis TaxID=86102 RepID=UPI002300E235|nr:NAD-dependent epimerase/dehydratase family protein [Idiomarina abyssalis]MDA6067163.1 NAD-dependent epimerase/dehydratase family protein [Idiomarina abyssalis]